MSSTRSASHFPFLSSASGVVVAVVGVFALVLCLALGGWTADGNLVTTCESRDIDADRAESHVFPFGVVCFPRDGGAPVQFAQSPSAWVLSGVFLAALALVVAGAALVLVPISRWDRRRHPRQRSDRSA